MPKCGRKLIFEIPGALKIETGDFRFPEVLENRVGSRLLEKNYERDSFFSAVTYDELKGNRLYASGAYYMESDNGIHFTQGKKQIHCSENPSIYKDENGGLVMYAGYGATGVGRAPDIDGHWRKENTDMPVFDNSSPFRNSSECPSIFEWNGYKYIIMGFTGYWQSGYQVCLWLQIAAAELLCLTDSIQNMMLDPMPLSRPKALAAVQHLNL